MIKKYIVISICICLSFAFIFMGTYWSRKGDGFLKNLTIKSEDESYEAEWLKDVMQGNNFGEDNSENAENKVSFAAWTEFKNEPVSDEVSGRGENANVIAVYGQSHCLLPFGKNLDICDGKGCIIGIELAKDLFGNENAEGQKLAWRGENWSVRGVVKEPSEIVMVQASQNLETLHLNRISILLTGKEDRRQVGEKFINMNGTPSDVLRFDYIYGFSWLKEMVPGEWADFESWKKNFEEYAKLVKLAESSEINEIESVGFNYKKKGRRFIFIGVCVGLLLVIQIYRCNKGGFKLVL